MHIAFNAFFLGEETTGSGQYMHHLLHALAQLDKGHEYFLYSGKKPGFAREPDFASPLQILYTPFPRRFENLNKLWFEQIAFPLACRRASVHLAHVPYFASPILPTVPTVVTIHDLIPLLLPAYRSSVFVQLYTHMVAAAARRATRIITDSQCSKNDIVRYLRVPSERVHVIYLAADPACQPVRDENVLAAVRHKYGLPDEYVLYLGGFDQRKNVPMLLKAYAQVAKILGAGTPYLVVAGRLPAMDTRLFPNPRRVAHELGIERKVIFTGWVAEEDKPALYSGALIFVFLSIYEGFGLMPLEAMSCGTPVLVSRAASLPEVVGKGGWMVDPMDLDEVTEGIRTLLCDPALRQELAQNALAQARQFDWGKTAEQTFAVYELAVQKPIAQRQICEFD
ncbi:MAG: glycosyltransferase family 4 protein [Chloroflexi bacterium]|nr:glycosyltransferase family 4 protein [Chloroflexota bacterium]